METVHKEVKEANVCKTKPRAGLDIGETEDEINGEDESESQCLLPPRKGGMSRNTEKKTRRKVRWNDTNGNNLAEVLEYEPSEVSDSEDDDKDSCICSIM